MRLRCPHLDDLGPMARARLLKRIGRADPTAFYCQLCGAPNTKANDLALYRDNRERNRIMALCTRCAARSYQHEPGTLTLAARLLD